MTKFKFLPRNNLEKLPKESGVYCFKDRRILYIGKAVNVRERVRNHFQQPTYRDRFFLDKILKIGFIETDSEIEALLLEANLIKKYQPKYNVIWRDDKNYFFVGIVKGDLPRVFLTHQTKSKDENIKANYIGPFVDGVAVKKTLRLLRKIFPYYSVKKHPKVPCPWCHLNLCPGPNPDRKKYKRDIKNLIAVLKGKKQSVLIGLKKKMEMASKNQRFEEAAKVRDQIEVMERILTNSKIFNKFLPGPLTSWQELRKELKKILKTESSISRIEAYDVSNIQGKEATGAMICFINGKPDKNYYRHFKIKISGKPNDVLMLRETLIRRFNHPEWGLPDSVLIDGGKAQLNLAIKVLRSSKPSFKKIEIMALAKKKNQLFIEKQKEPIFLTNLSNQISNLILQIRDEAHRFAIAYHRKLRYKNLLFSAEEP